MYGKWYEGRKGNFYRAVSHSKVCFSTKIFLVTNRFFNDVNFR